jgi:1-acyl-sn-glycerol-3-phosphate acyltransferase
LFRPWGFGALLRSVNVLPVDQDGVGKEGLQSILRQLKDGWPVLVFPEGSRSNDGRMQKLRPGVHLLIKRVQAPIVPVGVAGTFEAWPRHQALPLPAPLFLPAEASTIAVSVGKAVDGRRYSTMPREEVLVELFTLLQTEQERAQRLRRK